MDDSETLRQLNRDIETGFESMRLTWLDAAHGQKTNQMARQELVDTGKELAPLVQRRDEIRRETRESIGGEPLAGSGFENETPDEGFTSQASETEVPSEDAPLPGQ